MRRFPALLASMVVGLFVGGMLAPTPASADSIVTTCTDASLRTAVSHGGVVTFGVDCTDLVLTTAISIASSLNVDIEGGGHAVALDGAKYHGVDAESRARLRAAWNPPHYLPLLAFAAFLVVGSLPAVFTVRSRRSRRLRRSG